MVTQHLSPFLKSIPVFKNFTWKLRASGVITIDLRGRVLGCQGNVNVRTMSRRQACSEFGVMGLVVE